MTIHHLNLWDFGTVIYCLLSDEYMETPAHLA